MRRADCWPAQGRGHNTSGSVYKRARAAVMCEERMPVRRADCWRAWPRAEDTPYQILQLKVVSLVL